MSAYAPFTPSHDDQRSPPLFYRGCWHRVAQDYINFNSATSVGCCACTRFTIKFSSRAKEGARLGFCSPLPRPPYCRPFYKVSDRIPVLMWMFILSEHLEILCVGHYPHAIWLPDGCPRTLLLRYLTGRMLFYYSVFYSLVNFIPTWKVN